MFKSVCLLLQLFRMMQNGCPESRVEGIFCLCRTVGCLLCELMECERLSEICSWWKNQRGGCLAV